MKPLFPSTPPNELPEHLRWRTVKVKVGITGPLILAGPVIGLHTHHPANRTLPCLKRLPNCTMECPWCRFAVRYTSYTPCYDPHARKQKAIVIQGGKRTYESVVNGRVGQLVGIARGEGDRDTALFRPWPELVAPALTKPFAGREAADITCYLLHLWQWRELSEHFGEKFWPSISTTEIEIGRKTMRAERPREAHGE